jgi:hypothetical protein
MRKIQVIRLCDFCGPSSETAASESLIIGIAWDEEQPVLRQVDLCADHYLQRVREVQEALSHCPEWKPKAAEKPKAAAKPTVWADCPVCDKNIRRNSMVTHIWGVHRANEIRPDSPPLCPTCKKPFPKRLSMTQHRMRSHGYDPLGEALKGIPRKKAS